MKTQNDTFNDAQRADIRIVDIIFQFSQFGLKLPVFFRGEIIYTGQYIIYAM